MALRSVKVHLNIHDHLTDTQQPIECVEARYDAAQGHLTYRERMSQARVELHLDNETCRIERHAEASTHIHLDLNQPADFIVGQPSLQGKTQLLEYQVETHRIVIHYQLQQDLQLITEQTLTYTLIEADA